MAYLYATGLQYFHTADHYLLHPGSAAGTPDNDAAHRVAHRQRVAQNDASSGPPLRAACGATARCSNSKSSSRSEPLHCSQVRCTPVHCTPGTPSTANSRLHCDTLRHGPARFTQEHCVRHNYSGTSGSPCCNALRWALTREQAKLPEGKAAAVHTCTAAGAVTRCASL